MSSNIEIIKRWIQNETAFIGRTDESFIAPFLDICNDDVEKTKQRMARYYELRRLYPVLMRNRDCLHEKYVKLLRQKVIYSDIMMENYELPAVIAVKVSRLESDDNLYDAVRALILAIETCLLDSARFRKYGGMAIFDLDNVKFTHAIQLTPKLVMQTWKCIWEGVPIKVKGLLFVNAGSMLRAVINVGSLFLPTEIRNTMTISSGSWESIGDIVPPQCLPIEYGGTNGTMDEKLGYLESFVLRWRDYLLDDEQYGFNDIKEES